MIDNINSGFDITEGESEDILKVEIDCITPPDEDQLSEIKNFLIRRYKKEEVVFSIKKDTTVGGGFKLFVDDDCYDFSTKGRLQQLRDNILAQNPDAGSENMVSLMREDIESFNLSTGFQRVGFVFSVGDGIAVITGLHEVEYGEIVIFECGLKGMVQDIRADDTTGIIVFGDDSEIVEGMKVIRTHRMAGIPISSKIKGRIVDPLGNPVDGKGDLEVSKYFPIEWPAPGIIDRKPVDRPLETGLLAIDAMFPIGMGQRELIIGDRQTGKTTIAVDTILNQKGKGVICIYVAIGQKASSVAKVVSALERGGAMDYTVVVYSSASDKAALQYIAPYAGCAIAEYFMTRHHDTLIVYDDLSKHAVAYRTLSLLLERAPGREAYPGDVFYLHSRLLERSAQLSDDHGGGSMTALPIVETQEGDVSAYIPTNIISITDGQIFLENDLFFAGQRPAVNIGLSVSRVGGAAQTDVMKRSVGSIRLDLAQYREMQVFSQFGGELDSNTVRQLKYGEGLMMLLRQNKQSPMELHKQVITLICAENYFFIDVPVKEIKAWQEELLSYFEDHYEDICLDIDTNRKYSDRLKRKILGAAKEFAALKAKESEKETN